MTRLYVGFILFLSYFVAVGQVSFVQLPRDLQLYPRDANSQAKVVISGSMSKAGYTKIGVQVLRQGIATQMLSQTFVATASNSTFTLSSTIKAEPAEYSFRVFIYKGADSTLVAERKRVVCGDVYIIHGQSNALALAELDTYYSTNFDDTYLRNVDYPYGGATSAMAWYPAKLPYATVGGLGLTIQRLILQTYGIPTCVINGAEGGTAIAPLLARNPANHADTSTFYGNLLFRAQWAGVAKLAKGIIWRQGEEDAGTGIPGYAGKFATLYNQFREDYGNTRIYVGQINILDNTNPQDSAAALRDFQRRTKYIFNNVETIASVGTPGYQGVHYVGLSYQQLAFEQFRQIARDVYGSTDTLQINSPDIKKVFYNARKDTITLVYNDQMVWKSDTAFYNFATGAKTYSRQQIDYFYLDRQAGLLSSGSASGDRVMLALKQPASAKALRYLPAYFSDNFSAFYDGPTLKNTRGMRAFSFDNVAIADAIAGVTTLIAKSILDKQIQLNWTPSATAQTQILERSDGTTGNFKQIASFNGTTTTYTDNSLSTASNTYYYRLKAFSNTSESPYSNTASVLVGQVVFDQLPQDLQLYPRDVNNVAAVVVSGKVVVAGYTKMGVQVLRAGKLTQVISQTIDPAVTNAPFKLSPTIKAEAAEYSFRVFLYKGADSTLIAERNRIVSGDVYIIDGQSNALALAGLDTYYSTTFDDTYLRNATYPTGGATSAMAWYAAKLPYASVGGFGLTIQRLILQTYGIPTCVLNGAQSGTSIDLLVARDPANHANPANLYGNLLYRAQWAGVTKAVKAIIWREGDEDTGTGISGYAGKFSTLYNQFREDYGDMRIYVGQINILNNTNPQDSAASLRDFQRRTKYLFKNVETIATVGTPGYQGMTYTPVAYQQLAFEQFRQIARDIYGAQDTLQINSPNVKRAFYNARKDSILVDFTDQIVWKNDTTLTNTTTGAKITRVQKDYFYLDGQAGLLAGGSATGSRITLALKQPASAKSLRYLPTYFSDTFSAFYDGPTLKNSRGMRAFSFDGVPIVDAIATVTLIAKPLSEKQIQLNWTASATAQTQTLERSDGTTANFKQVASLNGTTATFTDTNLPDIFGTYYYRLRAFSSTSESGYSNIVSARPLVLGIEPTEPSVQVYPNPLAADQVLHVIANQVTFTEVTVRDMLGRVVKSWRGTSRNTLSLELTELEAGFYIADLQTADGQMLHRKIVIH